MDSAEIVVSEIEREHRSEVIPLLAECVCQARESANRRSHAEIATLNDARADSLRIRIADQRFNGASFRAARCKQICQRAGLEDQCAALGWGQTAKPAIAVTTDSTPAKRAGNRPNRGEAAKPAIEVTPTLACLSNSPPSAPPAATPPALRVPVNHTAS